MSPSPIDAAAEQKMLPERSAAWGLVSGRADELERGLLKAVEGLGNLEAAGRYHLLGGGKRLRGRLALAAGMGLGCPFPHALKIAIAVELLHNASLVHDDLQDSDQRRRGRPSVWAKFDKSTALLVGDVLIAKAFSSLSEFSSPRSGELIQILADCVARLASGQASDGQVSGDPSARSRAHRQPIGATAPPRLERTIEAYEELALAKTGWLFSLPPALVCVHVHGKGHIFEGTMESFAWLGVAFQIFDDIVDLTAGKGRDVGSDLRCDRLSAAVLHALPGHPSSVSGPRPSIEERAQEILRGPGMASVLDHQRSVIARAMEAGAELPLPLAGVLRDAAAELQAATERVAGSAVPYSPLARSMS